MRIPFRLTLFGLGSLTLVAVSAISAFATGISVPPSNIGTDFIPIFADDLKPPACSALYVTNIISGSGILSGTTGNDLIIGSTGPDSIDGLGGDDCILGGGGDDSLLGNDGNDVCLGGPGNDTFTNCEVEAQ